MLRTHCILLVAVAAAVVPIPSAAQDRKAVEYGKYVCVTDRAVGFQTPENSAQRYAGSIQMSPERQRFFITIRKIARAESPLTMLKDGFVQHSSDYCFSRESIEKLDKQWEHGGTNYTSPGVEQFNEWCLARSTVELNAGGSSAKYYSLGNNIFFDSLGNKFWIWNGWSFLWNFTNFAGDFYMMEGRCDLIK